MAELSPKQEVALATLRRRGDRGAYAKAVADALAREAGEPRQGRRYVRAATALLSQLHDKGVAYAEWVDWRGCWRWFAETDNEEESNE